MQALAPAQPARRQPPKPGQTAPAPDKGTARRFRKRKSKKKEERSSGGADAPSAAVSAASSAQSLYNAGVRAKRAGEVEKALDCYQRAAAEGYTKAMVNLGALYEKGDGVPRDDEAAVGWFREAASLGDSAAQFALGMHLKRGLGVPRKDPEKAWVQLSRAANAGHASAQFNLALMCESGVGCALDLGRAKELYEAAAAQGHAKAMVNLGSLYDRGGAPRDVAKPHGPAAAAAQRLEGGGQANPALACEMYRQALEVGGDSGASGLAKYNLSCNLKQGRGVAADGEAAVELLAAAAHEGVPQAQFNLATYVLRGAGRGRAGQMTARGTALPTPAAAMALLAKAADGGAEKAARSLARMAVATEARAPAPTDAAAADNNGGQNDQAPANTLSREPNDRTSGVRGAPSDACRARVRAAVEKRRADRRLPAGGLGGAAATGGAAAAVGAGGAMQIADITDSSEEEDEGREAARRRRREQNRERVARRQASGRTGSGIRGRGTARTVTATMFAGRSREPSLPS